MSLPRNVTRIRDLVLRAKLVDDLQMRSALARFQQWGGRLGHILVDMGFVDEAAFLQALAADIRLTPLPLPITLSDHRPLSLLTAEYCTQNAVFPLTIHGQSLTLVMADPTQLEIIDEVQSRSGLAVKAVLASESGIQTAIERYYHGRELRHESNRARKAVTRDMPIGSTPAQPFAAYRPNEQSFELDPNAHPPAPSIAAGIPTTSQPRARNPYPAPFHSSPSANTLDEMMGGDSLSFEELSRLQAVSANQEKAGVILRALQELLAEKGYWK